MSKLHVKTDDMVVVITGKDKSKKGKVLETDPKAGRVIVEGVNIVTRHKKPRGAQNPGGRIKKEAAIHASNVMLLCEKCNKATRLAHKITENGGKVRVCKKCGAQLEK